MANEPRAYREVIAEALRELRPGVEVRTVEARELESSVLRLAPDMVICNEARESVREGVKVWVELYPEFGSHSFVGVGSSVSTVEEIQLSDLLDLLDRTK